MRVAAIVFECLPDHRVPFAEACLRFSPQLCLKRPDAIFIEIGKCSALYREETFLKGVQILLTRFSLKAKVKIGDTILSSLLLTKYGTVDPHRLTLDCFRDCLDPFQSDPKSGKISEDIQDSLQRVGIKTVSGFLGLPSTELPARFGAAGTMIRARLLGEMDSGWPLWIAEEKILERMELFDGDRCSEVEPLLFYLKPLLDRAFSRLWGRGLRALSVRLRLSLEKSSVVKSPYPEWLIEFMLPQTTVRGTLPIIRERLERDLSRSPLRASVLAIDLEILQTDRDYQGQRHFFHNREDIESAFSSALSQLSEALGKENIFRATIHEEVIPELSWSKTFTEQKLLPDLEDFIPERPLRVLPEPISIQITNGMFHFKARSKKIVEWSSPEEVSTYRLDKEYKRSYYRLRLEGNSMQPWVFKCDKGYYWLHGWFR